MDLLLMGMIAAGMGASMMRSVQMDPQKFGSIIADRSDMKDTSCFCIPHSDQVCVEVTVTGIIMLRPQHLYHSECIDNTQWVQKERKKPAR